MGKEYPETMQTKAWAMKSLNTQLASWTQLRHDTVLYVKPPSGAGHKCEYPAGLVEPTPPFWGRLEKRPSAAADLIEASPSPSREVEIEVERRPDRQYTIP